jgi:hypothetical protein
VKASWVGVIAKKVSGENWIAPKRSRSSFQLEKIFTLKRRRLGEQPERKARICAVKLDVKRERGSDAEIVFNS